MSSDKVSEWKKIDRKQTEWSQLILYGIILFL